MGGFRFGTRPFSSPDAPSPFLKIEQEFGLKKILILLLLLVTVSGCGGVLNPQITMQDLNVVSLDTSGAGMELFLRVKNPNKFDILLKGYSYDLKVMALPLAKGGAREEVRIPGRAETDLRIPIRVGFSDLLEILKRKPDPDRIPYQLAAGLDLDTPVGQVTVPFSRTGTYAIPQKYRPATLFGKVTDLFRF